MEIPYILTIKFPNGTTKVKKANVEKQILPYLVMKLKAQYRMAEIDWQGANGDSGTTEIKR